jgi:RNA polymerase sigma factor (sigma-70 family)
MDPKRLSNRDLIQHLTQAPADDPRWREFVSRFRPRLRLSVYRCFQTEAERNPGVGAGPPSEIVDDLTQEVFVRLLDGERRALSRFQGRTEHSAYTYLSAIAVNLVRDHFRTLRADKTPKAPTSLSNAIGPEPGDEGPVFAQTLVSGGAGPERFVASSELRDEIRAVVDELSPRGSTSARDRLVFQLFFIEGLTVDEIAANRSIRLSASGVEKCIRRIRKALKDRLSSNRGR